MSVYRPKGSPFYHYDFQWRSDRFYGSTKRTSRREAEAVERAERERVKFAGPTRSVAPTLDDAVGRYWTEWAQHHAGADNTWRDLGRLVDYFGATKLLTEITDDDVARLVAWRRGHRVIRNKKAKPDDCPLISNATVNRSTTEVLRKLFTRAKDAWGLCFDREPKWRKRRPRSERAKQGRARYHRSDHRRRPRNTVATARPPSRVRLHLHCPAHP
jgi:hypothetical protein